MPFTKPTPIELAAFMRAGTTEYPTADLQAVIDLGCALLDTRLVSAWRPMPQGLYTQLALEVAHTIFKRKNSVSGASQFAFEGGSPVFDPKDPLQKVWPLLRMYTTPFPLPPVEVVTP